MPIFGNISAKGTLMFGLGAGEILIILLLAIIFIGPKELPRVGSQLGKLYRNFTKVADELKGAVDREVRLEEDKGSSKTPS